MNTFLTWTVAIGLITAWSAFLVFVDPLSLIFNWVQERRIRREQPQWEPDEVWAAQFRQHQ